MTICDNFTNSLAAITSLIGVMTPSTPMTGGINCVSNWHGQYSDTRSLHTRLFDTGHMWPLVSMLFRC